MIIINLIAGAVSLALFIGMWYLMFKVDCVSVGPVAGAMVAPFLLFMILQLSMLNFVNGELVTISDIETETLVTEIATFEDGSYLKRDDKSKEYILMTKKRDGVMEKSYPVWDTIIVDLGSNDTPRVVRPERIITRKYEGSKYSKSLNVEIPSEEIEIIDLYEESFKIYIPLGK